MGDAFRAGDRAAFAKTASEYLGWMTVEHPDWTHKLNYEWRFNLMQPFYHSMVLYVGAFLLACVSWLCCPKGLAQDGVLLVMLLALAVHSFGMFSRMYLQGRPPVTNLYSSAIFVGWGAVLIGLVLERIFRDGIGAACAGLIGFITLIIAHHLGSSGDTLEMMQAVLDSNIWLATHVVVITVGLFRDVPRRHAGHRLCACWAVHPPVLTREIAKVLTSHGLWRRLLRHALQLRRHGARRHLGGPVMGPLLGLGSEGKRRAAHRPLVRAHPARPLGRLHPPARADGHGDLRQRHHRVLVVRREHARRRPSLLRLHGQGVSRGWWDSSSRSSCWSVLTRLPASCWRSFRDAQPRDAKAAGFVDVPVPAR